MPNAKSTRPELTQLSQLPEMCQSVLDEEMLQHLCSDLQKCAKIESVMVKAGPGLATADSLPLAEALDLLRAEKVRGVQVRYLFDRAAWIDTFLKSPQGVQLTRVRHDV